MRGRELKGNKRLQTCEAMFPGKCQHYTELNYENKGKYKLPEGTENENVTSQRYFRIQLRRLKESENLSADVY